MYVYSSPLCVFLINTEELIDAANDCHAGLVLYEILTTIGRRNGIAIVNASDMELALRPSTIDSLPDNTEMASADEELELARSDLESTEEGRKRAKKPPRVGRAVMAYQMWFEGAELPELCVRLRSAENPLKTSTVR